MSEPILYILMRNDLPSMNAGKAMAQASHASNAFVYKMNNGSNHTGITQIKLELFEAWEGKTPLAMGFGTVLVLAAGIKDLGLAVQTAARSETLVGGLVEDPTYPYRVSAEIAALIPTTVDTAPRQANGDTVNMWRKEVTCGYVFGDKEECKKVVGHLALHP